MLIDIQLPIKNHYKERFECIEKELKNITDEANSILKDSSYSNIEIDKMMDNGVVKTVQYLNERTADILKIIEEMKGIKPC